MSFSFPSLRSLPFSAFDYSDSGSTVSQVCGLWHISPRASLSLLGLRNGSPNISLIGLANNQPYSTLLFLAGIILIDQCLCLIGC